MAGVATERQQQFWRAYDENPIGSMAVAMLRGHQLGDRVKGNFRTAGPPAMQCGRLEAAFRGEPLHAHGQGDGHGHGQAFRHQRYGLADRNH